MGLICMIPRYSFSDAAKSQYKVESRHVELAKAFNCAWAQWMHNRAEMQDGNS